MKVLLYTQGADGRAGRIKSVLQGVVNEESIEAFHRIQDLTNYFCSPRPADGLTIGVFAVDDHDHLRELVARRELIAKVRIILVLPDRTPETIAAGHSLQPRFITYRDSDLEKIGSVLRKIIETTSHAAAN